MAQAACQCHNLLHAIYDPTDICALVQVLLYVGSCVFVVCHVVVIAAWFKAVYSVVVVQSLTARLLNEAR